MHVPGAAAGGGGPWARLAMTVSSPTSTRPERQRECERERANDETMM